MNKKGFTLIELMVVVLIISIIAALVGPTIFKKIGKSKQVAAQAQIEMLGMALDSYRLDNDDYPSELAALQEKPTNLINPEKWDGPYLKKEIPDDPWGNPYMYICPGKVNPTTYDLLSYGSDGKEGGDNDARDIVSWKGLEKSVR
ncbi:type II secretion system major pseudopilin GspG [Candidatus Desantisbacteria bacterium]|nr:type II secretion system major pseudopilin GspG [Candidatus Desantisbacteria bacterium]